MTAPVCYAVVRMAKVINLNRARKARAKRAEQREADSNAIRHGQTKAERAEQARLQTKLDATLDGAKRDTPEPES